jgi:Asp-tRNA(Asn)/Glu-tRNA(Gln) amidotransferase A subunit family amidase
VGIPDHYFMEGLDPDIADAMSRAAATLASLGATIVSVAIIADPDMWSAPGLIVRADAYAVYRGRLRRDPGSFSKELRQKFRIAASVRAWQVAWAIQQQHRWKRQLRQVFRLVDAVLCPTTRITAPSFAGLDPFVATAELTRLTYPWSFANVPSVSFPVGLSRGGLPIGGQLVAPPWHDEWLLSLVEAYQRATDWHEARPPL